QTGQADRLLYVAHVLLLLDQKASLWAPGDGDGFAAAGKRFAGLRLYCHVLAVRPFGVDVADAAQIGDAAHLGLHGIGAAAAEMKMLRSRTEQTTIPTCASNVGPAAATNDALE